MSKWTYDECAAHWAGRRKTNDYRSVADCGWNRSREFMAYNEADDCFDFTLYSTIVVKVFRKKYVINCGGWWSNLTRKKIREWAGVNLNGSYRWKGRYIEDKFVYYNGKLVSVYYPRMEVTLNGEPLKPLMPTGRRLRKGVTKEFTDMAKQVRQALMPRALLGEFEKTPGDAYDGYELIKLMREVAAKSGGLFPEFMVPDELAPLFMHRPQVPFGRTYLYRRFSRNGDHDRTGVQCLEANIAAAKRAWLNDQPPGSMYEIVQKDFNDN